jgi:1-acyl-sn-glycerol-3-phosphate acyltransferase
MTTLRSLLFSLAFYLNTFFFGLLIVLLSRLLPYGAMTRLGRAWSSVSLWLLAVICGLRHRIQGLEQLPEGPCVVLCKHQSTWETISLRRILPLAQTWVLKQELLRIPVFGWALACYEPIALDRSAGRKAMRQLLEQGQIQLELGRCVVIFPEGTRVAAGKRGRYNIGGALLAEKAGVPVVPIAHNAGVFWRRRGIRKHPGTIDLVIGAPIQTDGRKPSEINAAVEDWIEYTVAALPGPPSPRAG